MKTLPYHVCQSGAFSSWDLPINFSSLSNLKLGHDCWIPTHLGDDLLLVQVATQSTQLFLNVVSCPGQRLAFEMILSTQKVGEKWDLKSRFRVRTPVKDKTIPGNKSRHSNRNICANKNNYVSLCFYSQYNSSELDPVRDEKETGDILWISVILCKEAAAFVFGVWWTTSSSRGPSCRNEKNTAEREDLTVSCTEAKQAGSLILTACSKDCLTFRWHQAPKCSQSYFVSM